MSWETLELGRFGGSAPPLPLGQVSMSKSLNNRSPIFRINVNRKDLPKDCARVTIKIDKKRQRVGFFHDKGEHSRKLVHLKSAKLVYLTLSRKHLDPLGFTKGRYKTVTPKDAMGGMLFYVSPKQKIEQPQETV